jgi:hypothetical protein
MVSQFSLNIVQHRIWKIAFVTLAIPHSHIQETLYQVSIFRVKDG